MSASPGDTLIELSHPPRQTLEADITLIATQKISSFASSSPDLMPRAQGPLLFEDVLKTSRRQGFLWDSNSLCLFAASLGPTL